MNIIFNFFWRFSETEKELTYTSKITTNLTIFALVLFCLFIGTQLLLLLNQTNSEIIIDNSDVELFKSSILFYQRLMELIIYPAFFLLLLGNLRITINTLRARLKGKSVIVKGTLLSIFHANNENPFTIIVEK